MSWSKWLEPGFFINYRDFDGNRVYQKVERRDFAHMEWEFGYPDKARADRVVPPLTLKGPYVPGGTDTVVQSTSSSVLHQIVHGQKPECYLYRQWPAESKRHGFPKKVWHSSELREVAHFTMEMSPFSKPSFITEFFMLKDVLNQIDFSIYNPSDEIPILPRLNFLAAKLLLELVGTVSLTETGVDQRPSSDRYRETLDKLWRGLLYSRSITFDWPQQLSKS